MIVKTIRDEIYEIDPIKFHLGKSFMVEKTDSSLGKYFASKKELKSGLRKGSARYAITSNGDEKPSQKNLDEESYSIAVQRNGRELAIGCMKFDAENAGKIRKWLRS